jgi:hypothetical protein
LFGVGTVAPYLLYRSTGSAWDQIGGAGGSSVTTSDTAPTTPSDGDLWYDSTTGKTFVWYEDGSSDQWVEVGANAQIVIPQHGSSHVRGGSDVIDGDRLTVDYVPTRYTRNSAASGAGDNTDLTAHLSGIDARFAPALVTSLPVSPYDGQIVYYQADSTNGVVWQLRYNSSSASSYKWEFIGGAPLYQRDSSARTTASTTYQTTGSPSFTLNLNGDFECVYGAAYFQNNAASPNAFVLALHVNGSEVAFSNGQAATNGYVYPVSYTFRQNNYSSGQLIDVRYKSSSGLSMSVDRMFLLIRPIRVG